MYPTYLSHSFTQAALSLILFWSAKLLKVFEHCLIITLLCLAPLHTVIYIQCLSTYYSQKNSYLLVTWLLSSSTFPHVQVKLLLKPLPVLCCMHGCSFNSVRAYSCSISFLFFSKFIPSNTVTCLQPLLVPCHFVGSVH